MARTRPRSRSLPDILAGLDSKGKEVADCYCPVQAGGVKEESPACTWTSTRVYLLDFAWAPPDTITDSAALALPEAV